LQYLVTGGAGFVGTNLIKKLLDEGHRVVSVDNYSTGLRENEQKGCQYFDIDICKVKDYPIDKPDVIFHLAALPRIQPSFEYPLSTFDANVKGTINVLEWARKKNCPVVYAGSSSNHGDKLSNPYTFSKWQGEELCKLYNKIYHLPVSICRFYNVYGSYELTEGDYCTLIGIFKNQYENKQPLTITGDGEQRRDFTHVEDIVDCLVECYGLESLSP
jgi:UDP-glucose 4-epimerase